MIAANESKYIAELVHRLFKMTAKELNQITKYMPTLFKMIAVQFHLKKQNKTKPQLLHRY